MVESTPFGCPPISASLIDAGDLAARTQAFAAKPLRYGYNELFNSNPQEIPQNFCNALACMGSTASVPRGLTAEHQAGHGPATT